MADICYGSHLSFNQIVDAFKCIGETSNTSREAELRTSGLKDRLSQQFGIDELQASLFYKRILNYLPSFGSTLFNAYEDLVVEMHDVITKPESRHPSNNTLLTGITGIDRLRDFATNIQPPLSGVMGNIMGLNRGASKYLFGENREQVSIWPRGSIGFFLGNNQVTLTKEDKKEIKRLIKEEVAKASAANKLQSVLEKLNAANLNKKEISTLIEALKAKASKGAKENN